jgi:ribonuclease PH
MKRARVDGRGDAQLRPMTAEFRLLEGADGSARLAAGGTRVLAAVLGPRPARHPRLDDPDGAVLELYVTLPTRLLALAAGAAAMASTAAPPISAASGSADALEGEGGGILALGGGAGGSGGASAAAAMLARSSGSGASPEALRLASSLRAALVPLVVASALPHTVVTVHIAVQSDEGGAEAAAFNAAILALVDAGVPLRDLAAAATIAALPGGAAGGGARFLLDPTAEEEAAAAAAAAASGASGADGAAGARVDDPFFAAGEVLGESSSGSRGGAPGGGLLTAAFAASDLKSEAGGPLLLRVAGDFAAPAAPAPPAAAAGSWRGVLVAARPAAATALAFLRLALARKVAREAVN